MKKLIILAIIFLLSTIGISQCISGSPPVLSCGTPITVASNSPSGQYGTASTGDPTCKVSGDKVTDADLFEVTYSIGMVVSVDMCLSAANYVSVLSTDGCTELACETYGSSYVQDATSCNGLRKTTISLDDLNLNVGDKYYIKVQGVANCGGTPCSSASISGRSYTISCDTELANSCSNNQVMSGGSTYSIDNYNTADNSNLPNTEGGSCGYSIESNLMFKWCTDISNTQVSVQMTGVTIEAGSNVQFSVLQGNCGGTYTTIQCNSGIASDQTIPINNIPPNGTAPNTCYWLMFDGNAGTWFTMNVTLIDAQVLPIELVEFKGESNGSFNKLSWTTASETNNDYFELEWSTDAASWETIHQIEGTNSDANQYYQHHHSTSTSSNYYRLKQTDYDGKYKLSRIIYVEKFGNVKNNSYFYINVLGQIVSETYTGYKTKVELK
jgi:hypothetical protein